MFAAELLAWQSACCRRTGAGAGRVGVMQVPAKGRTSEGRDSTFWNPRIQSQRQRCRVCCTHVSCRRLHVRKVHAATRIGLHGIVAACVPWVISRGRHPSMGHPSPPYCTITVVLSDKLLVLSLPNAERAYHIAGALSSFLKNHRRATFRESPPPCSATRASVCKLDLQPNPEIQWERPSLVPFLVGTCITPPTRPVTCARPPPARTLPRTTRLQVVFRSPRVQGSFGRSHVPRLAQSLAPPRRAALQRRAVARRRA